MEFVSPILEGIGKLAVEVVAILALAAILWAMLDAYKKLAESMERVAGAFEKVNDMADQTNQNQVKIIEMLSALQIKVGESSERCALLNKDKNV